MNKPIPASLIYRTKKTTSSPTGEVELGTSKVTYGDIQEMNAISEKILSLIVQKHS